MNSDRDHKRAPDLVSLARTSFTDFTDAEFKLLHAVPKGEVAFCGPDMNFDAPANDPSKASQWGNDRQIRADLIRWLCVDRDAKELVDPKGIHAFVAKITGAMDLSYVIVPFPLTLWRCSLMDHVNLRAVEIPKIDFQGVFVHSGGADTAKVKGDVLFSKGFRADGEVRLVGP
jgi:hypothetical protein